MSGARWFKTFLRHHPEFSTHTSESVTLSSAILGEEDIREW
jgi:hypothetical protein